MQSGRNVQVIELNRNISSISHVNDSESPHFLQKEPDSDPFYYKPGLQGGMIPFHMKRPRFDDEKIEKKQFNTSRTPEHYPVAKTELLKKMQKVGSVIHLSERLNHIVKNNLPR